ncbi:hypothetical protein ACH3VR_18005 [Microbacterium sp. B2969]|uniref:Luciferase-like domain-containing protein n=1 Tax=Microbacterium alkaliflavum TaxID=3248839 RepID=A0ABW7QBK2_9MICO
MTRIGFHASHEQFAPSRLLALVRDAERAGDDAALGAAADQWRQATAPGDVVWDLEQPEDFDRLSDPGDEDALRAAVLIGSDPRGMAERLARIAAVGFDELYVHHVGLDQDAFLARAASQLLPALRKALA